MNTSIVPVAIVYGSESDTPVMQKAAEVLRTLDIPFEAYVISAHRTPELLRETIAALEAKGVGVVIAGAGLAAHLPGVIASMTLLPVIGVPIESGALHGMDALLSIVQMPRPVPVATVGVGNGANAAYLAGEILALADPDLRERLARHRASLKAAFEQDHRDPVAL